MRLFTIKSETVGKKNHEIPTKFLFKTFVNLLYKSRYMVVNKMKAKVIEII